MPHTPPPTNPLAYLPRSGPAAGVYRRYRRTATGPAPRQVRVTKTSETNAWRRVAASQLADHPDVRPLLEHAQLHSGAWYARRPVMRNPHLDLDTRIRVTAGTNQAWRVAFTLATPHVPDDVAAGWLDLRPRDWPALPSDLHDLLTTRPGLTPVAANGDMRVACAVPGIAWVDTATAASVLARANPRTHAGRTCLQEAISNPTLQADLRQAAFTDATRHWPARRRAAARTVLTQATTVTADQLAGASDDDLTVLADWATGAVENDPWEPGKHRLKPATWRHVRPHAASRPTLTAETRDWESRLEIGRMLPAFTPAAQHLTVPHALGGPATGPSRGTLADQLLSAVVWDTSVNTWPAFESYDVDELTARTLHVELQHNPTAWDTYATLAPEWDGTLGDLIRTCRTL